MPWSVGTHLSIWQVPSERCTASQQPAGFWMWSSRKLALSNLMVISVAFTAVTHRHPVVEVDNTVAIGHHAVAYQVGDVDVAANLIGTATIP